MSFILDLKPVEAVAFFAGQALKFHGGTSTMEQAIKRGLAKAYDAYTEAGMYDKAAEVRNLTVADVRAHCRPTNKRTAPDEEPGDMGNHYDDYRSAKQRRRNGLFD